MTTGKRGHYPWSDLAFGLTIAAAVLTSAAGPASADVAGAGAALPDAAATENLFLEVVLNRMPLREIAHFVLRGDRMYADAEVLRGLGLTWPGAAAASGLVALDSLP